MNNYSEDTYLRSQMASKGSGRRKKRKPSKGVIALRIFILLFVIIMVIIGFIVAIKGLTSFFGEGKPKPIASDNNAVADVKKQEKIVENGSKNSKLYSAEFEKRVKSFMTANSGITKDNAVWMVNVNMDKQELTEATTLTVEELKQPTVIVSKRFKVPDNYAPDDLVKLTARDSIRKVTKEYFDKLRSAAAAEGFQISPVSGFRTVAYQNDLYNRYLQTDSAAMVDTYSARPGFSEHHTGMAIDVMGSNGEMTNFGASKESSWVKENAYKYGFIVRYFPETAGITGYKSEPWHLRYVGVDVATKMRDQGITTLEEYVGRYVKT